MDGDTTRSMREQIAAIDERGQRTEERGQRNAERMDRLEACLADNTKMTREMYDYLITARTGTKMIKGVATVGSGIAALWAAYLWLRDHIHW